jgi:YHS domain-containing protein
MIRLLIYGLLIYFGYRLVNAWAKSLMRSDEDLDRVPKSENTELIRDPQCGTYFLRQQGVESLVNGQKLFFCSERCRRDYLRKQEIS